MIPFVLAVSMLATAQIPAAAQRHQFATCLRTFMNAKLEERMAVAAFDTAVSTACAEQEAAYRTAYLAAATRAGDTRARAEQDASLEVQDLRANFRDLFHNSQPQ